ncbi:MAG: hypothetical protein R3234_05120 [Thermoanaerobaculia bacterium]|nr:hypothetical protein [Thermoanaerobaculia bacterium]
MSALRGVPRFLAAGIFALGLSLLGAGSGLTEVTVSDPEERAVDRTLRGTAPELRDRILAVVEEDPILLSDVRRVIALRLVERKPGESPAELRRRVLEGLVEQKLRFHEVTRYGFEQAPVDAVDRQMEELEGRWGGEEALERRLAEVGMDRAALRRMLARQLEVMLYVEELLGARVFVGLEEIRSYYENELVPELEGRGEEPPPLEEIREQIREVLRQRRLNRELEEWTEELRREADVVLHLEPSELPLPPVAEVIRDEDR